MEASPALFQGRTGWFSSSCPRAHILAWTANGGVKLSSAQTSGFLTVHGVDYIFLKGIDDPVYSRLINSTPILISSRWIQLSLEEDKRLPLGSFLLDDDPSPVGFAPRPSSAFKTPLRPLQAFSPALSAHSSSSSVFAIAPPPSTVPVRAAAARTKEVKRSPSSPRDESSVFSPAANTSLPRTGSGSTSDSSVIPISPPSSSFYPKPTFKRSSTPELENAPPATTPAIRLASVLLGKRKRSSGSASSSSLSTAPNSPDKPGLLALTSYLLPPSPTRPGGPPRTTPVRLLRAIRAVLPSADSVPDRGSYTFGIGGSQSHRGGVGMGVFDVEGGLGGGRFVVEPKKKHKRVKVEEKEEGALLLQKEKEKVPSSPVKIEADD